jgi:hypothetical protein
MNVMEVWQVIPKFDYRYMASNTGKVFDIKKWKEMKQTKMYRGYLQVYLMNQGKPTTQFVHRLVLMAFAGLPPNSKSVGMHMDDNTENNHLSNLEWGDMSVNMRQAYEKGRKRVVFIPAKGKFGKDSKYAKAVEQIDINSGATIKRFGSIVDAARELNIFGSHITSCCKGRINHAYGYKWRYVS